MERRKNRLQHTTTLTVEDLKIDLDTREVIRGGRFISLKPTTAKILEFLVKNSHRVVPRREIEKEIWGDQPPSGDPLRAHIYSIRQSVDKEENVKLVHTMHGVGYRIANLSTNAS